MTTITIVDPSKFITPHDPLCTKNKTHVFGGCVVWCPVLVAQHEELIRRDVIPGSGERGRLLANAFLNLSKRVRRLEATHVTRRCSGTATFEPGITSALDCSLTEGHDGACGLSRSAS